MEIYKKNTSFVPLYKFFLKPLSQDTQFSDKEAFNYFWETYIKYDNVNSQNEHFYACPCCGYISLLKLSDNYFCPVCHWELCYLELKYPFDPEIWYNNDNISLYQRQINFIESKK